MKKYYILLIVCFTSTILALDHSGPITTDEFWDNSHTHFIIGNVSVNSGVSLTIEPGCLIRFYENSSLQIKGTLIADGNCNERITFTSTMGGSQPGFWQNISFSQADAGCILDYCDIFYGGSVNGLLYLINSGNNVQITNCDIEYSATSGVYFDESNSGFIENCIIENNNEHGIYCNYSNAIPSISNCEINNNGNHGIYCSAGGNPSISDCVIQNNGDYAIRTYGDNVKNITGNMTISGNINNSIYVLSDNISSGTWNNHGVPYVLTGNMTINNDQILTINSGVTLKFNGNYYLLVNGKLIAEGTSENRITFTSNQSTPSPGDWKHIFFNNADNGCELNYCNISYGGSEANRGNVYIDESGDNVSLNNCNIEYSASNGIFLWANSSPSIINCSIKNNESYGVRIYSNTSHPAFGNSLSEWNDIYNNNGDGVGRSLRNSYTNNTAKYIYWGTTDENEIDLLIYDNEEGAETVNYTPWTNAEHSTEYPITNPNSPENVTISINGDSVHISWTEVVGASSYNVYSSNIPNAPEPWNFEQNVTTGISCTLPITNADKKFYFVKTVN